ncbi:DinB family protein [Pararcticibacter amylolyticus]|uniref:DinB-like domain-containing protein n=1 Tax=Pararcticibacter amylolyticus TaxID=2173175 RepID=A0A2U2PLP5_9SPHI|nr:DinB family protein [Pararcticibacter amylolyticus]PWG82327.1 hypothetical protein DDR33_00185 [Pararcticibacter amylolyticus]
MSMGINARSILDITSEYQEILKNLTDEEFCRQPEDGSWSCSEIFCHIVQVNVRSLLAIEKCIYGKQQQRRHGLPLVTRLILYFGRFPPGKLNIPSNILALVRVTTREEAKNDMIRFTVKLKELLPKISKCSSEQRIKHPRLGMLNCIQWLRFMEIYSRYHLKKLKKSLKRNGLHAG